MSIWHLRPPSLALVIRVPKTHTDPWARGWPREESDFSSLFHQPALETFIPHSSSLFLGALGYLPGFSCGFAVLLLRALTMSALDPSQPPSPRRLFHHRVLQWCLIQKQNCTLDSLAVPSTSPSSSHVSPTHLRGLPSPPRWCHIHFLR